MRKLSFFVLLSALLLPACGSKLPSLKPFKLDIQQGNVVTSKMLLQLRPGMTKSQVRYIMGTPLVVDGFHENRWDYFYAMRKQGQVIEKRRVILDFEKDALLRVRGDVVPEGDPSAKVDTVTPPTSVAKAPAPAEKSWLEKLKFWGDDTPTQPTAPVVAAAPAPVPQKVEEEKDKSWWDRFKFWGDDVPAKAATSVVVAVPELKASETLAPEVKPEATVKADVPEQKAVDTAETKPAEAIAPVQETLTAEETVVPAVTAEAPLATAKDAEAIESSVTAWAAAWRNKNIPAYLSAYAPEFKPEGMPSKKAWEAQRKQRLSPKQGSISLDISNVQVQQDGDQATVQFVQNYASKVYRDQVTKQLDLRLDPKTKAWLIVRETTLKNAPMPTKQQVIAPEGTEEHLDGVIEQIGF
jgi:outer membrane protein assembly factor BamE (lipoprotein component of BamABCDE complex)/ketosteroid isomerase-like protein